MATDHEAKLEMLLRQIAEQGAVIIRELRTLSTKVEGLAATTRPPPPAEPRVRPYDVPLDAGPPEPRMLAAAVREHLAAGRDAIGQADRGHNARRRDRVIGPPVPPPPPSQPFRAIRLHPTSSEFL